MLFYFYFVIINLVGEVMNKKIIEKLLKRMSDSIKDKDIINDFPSILKDLELLINIFNKKIEGVTVNQKVCPVYNIERYKAEFLAEFMKKYMELTYNDKFSYEINELVVIISPEGYDEKTDIVNISALGLLLNDKNIAGILKSTIHEYRHQHFFHFMHENSIEGMLKYPAYYITMAKNFIPKPLGEKYDEEGFFIGNPYYKSNHRRLYTEVDADSFAINTISRLLPDLYKQYPHKSKKLEDKVNRVQKELLKQLEVVEKELKEDNRLETIYMSELYLKRPITSKVLVDEQETDSLLYTDKCLKDNPILKDKYEVLNILMDEYRFKDYHELLLDKYESIKQYGNASKINAIYDNIINNDPMVLITKYVEEKNLDGIETFINNHPTFKYEYQSQIKELFNKETPGSEILNILSIDECAIMKKKGN